MGKKKTKQEVDCTQPTFRARYWDEEFQGLFCIIYSDTSLDSAMEYAKSHTGDRVLLDVKEFTNWVDAALSDDSDILKK